MVEDDYQVGKNRVARLMREMKMQVVQRFGRRKIAALEVGPPPGLFGVGDSYERFVQTCSVADQHPNDVPSVYYSKLVHVKHLCLGFHDT
ncbi:MAG: hypothetical protein OXC80_04425 [Gammaproteobacteria bacterium]|nr:hypothetical protein [Gammaproteobacteria bacterium]